MKKLDKAKELYIKLVAIERPSSDQKTAGPNEIGRAYIGLLQVQEALEVIEYEAELKVRQTRQIEKYRTQLRESKEKKLPKQQEEEEADILRRVQAKLDKDFAKKADVRLMWLDCLLCFEMDE